MSKIDILIPTWNNQPYLLPCLRSLLSYRGAEGLFHVYLINNGHPDSCNWVNNPNVTLLQTGGENLRWEGGLRLGLEHSKAPFVMFLNDDTYIPPGSWLWLNRLLEHFKDKSVGAVGPGTNVVMGSQNIFADIAPRIVSPTFLIGFCMLLSREALERAGGVDDTLPGGDDLDLSIRLRDAGYRLIADRGVFIYHHGFKTGNRVHGDASVSGGWNSYEFREKTDHALIRKHGFRKWYECIRGGFEQYQLEEWNADREGELIRAEIDPDGVILDLGCGPRKTIESAIGLDLKPKGEMIDTLAKELSQADIAHDVSKPLPFPSDYADTIIARHALEHMIDPVSTLSNWIDTLKVGGKLIISVPDEERYRTIPMNLEHLHAYTPESLKTLLTACGLRVEKQMDATNGVSFITIATKHEPQA